MIGGAPVAPDTIVVGAGPAGCAVAARLSRSGRRVLLVEAGGRGRNPMLSVPAAMMLTMRDPRYTWRFATEPEPGLDGRSPDWIAGRLLGGGSAINGMMYLRGHPLDYDRWRDEAGCAGWGFADILPFFRRAEDSDRPTSLWHGAGGPISITVGMPDPAIGPAFLEAVAAAGLPVVDDLNAGVAEGFGYFDRAIGRGRRSSVARAYLRGVARRDRLTVVTGARVLGLLIERGRVRGVRVAGRGGAIEEVRAADGVVLAAGCINTAHLLQLSGIGPADALRRHGIAVAIDAPQVGANVQNHVAYIQPHALDAPVTAYELRHPWRALRAGARYALFRRGILSGPLCPVGGLLRADPAAAVADTQVILGAGLPGTGAGWRSVLPAARGFTLMLNQGRPFSRGSIGLRSGDPAVPPAIRSGFFSDSRDLPLLAAAVERMRDLLARTPIAGAYARPLRQVAGGRDALTTDIRAHASSFYHAVGSCRMGDDEQAVVDTGMRVRGVTGLHVADTSVAPLLVNGNTTAMALMLGERAAHLIAGA